ncbi:hypothetical protein ACFTSE_23705 [Bacillus cereus]|uniref:hypothetical protein n=1 Tax=Bacillus cereus TaxID=1396 RepID=UPI0036295C25
MSFTQNLLWITLPSGVKTNGNSRMLQLSVFVNPRLNTEGQTLVDFPDFLNWGELMQPDKISFTLELSNGKKIPAKIVSDPPNPSLWQALFTKKIPVCTYNFKDDDFSNRPIVSFPVSTVLNYVKDCYQQIAKDSPFNMPNRHLQEGQTTLEGVFRKLIELQQSFIEIRDETYFSNLLNKYIEDAQQCARIRQSQQQLNGSLIEPLTGINDPELDSFFRAMLFHYRPAKAKPVDLPEGSDAHMYFQKEIDFHQMISALSDFPELLRRLGLIFDLQVPADALPMTSSGSSKVRVIPNWVSSFPTRDPVKQNQKKWTTNCCPWTVYDYVTSDGQDLFTASSQFGEITAGFWTPRNEVNLVQVDVDGAALKTLNLASSLERLGRIDPSLDTPDQTGVPTLRTGGISVVLNGYADQLNNTFNRSAVLNNKLNTDTNDNSLSDEADLYAEDLTRGYRLDVLEESTNEWRSLHERVGTYTILHSNEPDPVIVDEGFIQPSITKPAEPIDQPNDPTKELYVHESIFAWEGWSLSAPRPGKSISRSPNAPNPENPDPDTEPQDVHNTAMTQLGLETTFKVKRGTLPRLRFGKGYQLRARTVDLAGNSLTLKEATALEGVLPKIGALIPKNDNLIYRRFEPVNPPELVPRQLYSPNGNINDPNTTGYTEGESLERLVIRSNYDKSTEEFVSAKPVYHSFNERHIIAPKASLHLIELHGLLDEAFNHKEKKVMKKIYNLAKHEAGSLNDPSLSGIRFIKTSSDPSSTEGYAVHPEKQLTVPYLPDPWAEGVVFQGLPGYAPDKPYYVKFHEKPFRIRLVEGSNAPIWDETTRILTVQLPKSEIAHVRISSMFGGTHDVMGLWQWLVDAKIEQSKLAELKQGIYEGRHWMFTPYRDISLVHAVQQPLIRPKPNLNVERRIMSTAAYLRGSIHLHAPSTSKIDIWAEWTDYTDNPSKTAFETVKASAHVMELPTSLDDQPVHVIAPDAPDTLRLENDELLIFNCLQAYEAVREIQEVLDNPPTFLSTEQRSYYQGQINLAKKVTPHEFGDTKYRRVRYRVDATSRFREYFSTTELIDFVQKSPEIELDILSTAQPPAPRILYILPTFGWDQKTDAAGNITSVRSGGGLRVYLERPWYCSGEGELLGVVLGQKKPNQCDELYNYSTFWGRDPIWASSDLPAMDLKSFKNSKQSFENVQLNMSKETTYVEVSCFNVEWDDNLKLWYSDIELDTSDVYFPFIRLALTRFQPNSIDDLRLSPVILADFVQTAPNRAVTVTRDPNSQGLFSISVNGVTNTTQHLNNSTATTSQIRALVQQRNTSIEDEILGWESIPIKVELVPSIPDAQGIVVWQGQLSIPNEYQGKQLRIIVEEYETLPLATSPNQESEERLVYVDTIPL